MESKRCNVYFKYILGLFHSEVGGRFACVPICSATFNVHAARQARSETDPDEGPDEACRDEASLAQPDHIHFDYLGLESLPWVVFVVVSPPDSAADWMSASQITQS